MQHPKGLWILSISEAIGRFSYYGLQASFMLYLIHQFKMGHAHAYQLFGAFASLAFLMPVIGGWLGDKVFGLFPAMVLGLCLDFLGNAILALSATKVGLLLGAAVFLVGIGLFKSNVTTNVGLLYSSNKRQLKDQGISIFYAFMNAGSIVGPIVYGVLSTTLGWSYTFWAGAIAELIALILVIWNVQIIRCDDAKIAIPSVQETKGRVIRGFTWGIPLFLVVAIISLFEFLKVYNLVFLIVIAVICLYVVSIVLKSSNKLRNAIVIVCVLNFFAIFYYACYIQASSSLLLFVDHFVRVRLWHFRLPSQFYTTLEPIFFLLLTPLFGYLWRYMLKGREHIITQRMGLGLIFAVTSFLCFMEAAHFAQHLYTTLGFIVLGNMFLAAGELSIGPAVIVAISNLIPLKMQSTFMGIWWFVISLAYYLSNLVIAKLLFIRQDVHANVSSHYQFTFLIIAISVAIAAIVYGVLKVFLDKIYPTADTGELA